MHEGGITIESLNFSIAGIPITLTWAVFLQWFVMVFVIIAALILTRKLETVPKGKQVFVETVVEGIYKLVDSVMGREYRSFAPYIGTIMIYMLFLNILPLVGGLRAPTSDYSVALAFALMTFIIIQANAIKHGGLGGYLKGYTQPVAPLLPLNIMERVFVPVSLSLRLFGNITAAIIVVELIYEGLTFISEKVLHAIPGMTNIPILATLIPVPFHMYFDIFDGTLQMVVFSMLTMIFIKTTAEH
ncbi:ATP synthase subunit a [Clostridium cylindrosporum DSM 605]|uniref:ATP synthase subunit a n=2 Tax=Clostridium cylindrosporum TaxID=1495 RepID=A0A0J8DEW2_CLOCY|nr:ATP synthase subunit a [Clostridium cylindrosporum DSM 605]